MPKKKQFWGCHYPDITRPTDIHERGVSEKVRCDVPRVWWRTAPSREPARNTQPWYKSVSRETTQFTPLACESDWTSRSSLRGIDRETQNLRMWSPATHIKLPLIQMKTQSRSSITMPHHAARLDKLSWKGKPHASDRDS